jgi:3'-phosphoadenosine 5'-phosphosulfate sulfotransferase (PAPS reductase)/FAD synthetase
MKPDEILRLAFEKYHRPPKRPIANIVALYSGGYDSATATHVAKAWATQHVPDIPFLVLAVDTLLSADGWRNYVSDYAWEQRWDLSIAEPTNPDWYEQWVTEHGFPHTKQIHTMLFQKLKEDAYLAFMKQIKPSWFERTLFISGIRAEESEEREGFEPVNQPPRGGTAVFANPIFYWSMTDRTRYMIENGLPMDNPFYGTLGGSGDCYCNWHGYNRVDELEQKSPTLGAKIRPLHEECRAKHGYGYGEKPKGARRKLSYEDKLKEGNLPLFTEHGPMLCRGCKRPKVGVNEATEAVALDRMEW